MAERHWRTLCRISRIDEWSVNVVAPASLRRWFSVPRVAWPAELPLEVGRYFHARVNIGAAMRRDMSMCGPYELALEAAWDRARSLLAGAVKP